MVSSRDTLETIDLISADPIVARLHQRGKSWLRRRLKSRHWRRSIGRFFDGIEHPAASRGRVLQYVGIGSMHHTPLEILIYHLLRQRGFAVDYLIYGPQPRINEITTKACIETVGLAPFWQRSFQDAKSMLEYGNVVYQLIPETSSAQQLAADQSTLVDLFAFQLDGIEFGQIVLGSMYRFYKSLQFDDNAMDISRRLLRTAIENYQCVKQQCEAHDYQFLMFSHGIYVTWQPVAEYCRREGIDFVCYDRAKTRNTANFNVNQPSPDWSFGSAWDRYANRQLTSAESAWGEQYLADRETQSGDVYSYNPKPRSADIALEKSRLGIPLDRRVVTIFTNLIWDAANVARDIAFVSCLECIQQTIARFADDDRTQIVVRSHPAEQVLGTQQQYAALIRQHFAESLPRNVTIIEPDDQVNSFTMIELSDIGVVNTSTVGIEMAILGKPVILISETHYRNKGFTYDAESSADYFRLLDSLLRDPSVLTDQISLSRKYFFMMMSLYQQQLPTRYRNNGQFQGYQCGRFADLDGDQPIVRIVDALAKGMPSDFVCWPD